MSWFDDNGDIPSGPDWTFNTGDQSPPDFNQPGGDGFSPGQSGGGTGDAMPGASLPPGLDLSSITGLLGQAGKLFMNKDGSLNLPLLMSLLGTGVGGFLANKSINKGTGQMTDAIKQANSAITSILGGAQGAFKPYTDLGSMAAGKLAALPPSNLAGQFGPIGNGRGIGGPVTMAQLMKGGR